MPMLARAARMRTLALALLPALALAFLAGCTASGASGGNFELAPEKIGWYIGERAHFTLSIEPSLTKQSPDYLLDRHFAIEEIRYEERGAAIGGDYATRNPDDINLVMVQNETEGDEFTLNAIAPAVEIYVDIPAKLRDSEYVLEIELFKAGWVKSEPFRVDERESSDE
jgi:hypothetical protein